MNGLIDMHCHILPNVDDGARDMEQTIRMIKIAYKDGIRCMIATPHYHIGRMKADILRCQKMLEDVIVKIKEMGIDMELALGSEVFYYSEAMDRVNAGDILPLANSSYILWEFEPGVSYSHILSAINDCIMNGYVPILAHVERYICLVEKPARCVELIDLGALLQVNSSSILGKYGTKIKSFIKKLLKKRIVSFVATDAHSDEYRRPMLMDSYLYVCKKFGKDYADTIYVANQIKVLKDESI